MSTKDGDCLPNVAGLVLAAGTSERAGEVNKLLFPFQKRYERKAVVEHVAHALTNSHVRGVLVVTGHDAKSVEKAVLDSAVTVSWNMDYNDGQATSLAHGVALLYEYDAIVACLGDMPHVTSDAINGLVAAMVENPDKSFFVPVYKSKRGNPVLFTKETFSDIMCLKGDEGARTLFNRQPENLCEVVTDCEGVLIDYDTQAELADLPQ